MLVVTVLIPVTSKNLSVEIPISTDVPATDPFGTVKAIVVAALFISFTSKVTTRFAPPMVILAGTTALSCDAAKFVPSARFVQILRIASRDVPVAGL